MIGGCSLSAPLCFNRFGLQRYVAELPAMPLTASRRDTDLEPYAVDASEREFLGSGHLVSFFWLTRLHYDMKTVAKGCGTASGSTPLGAVRQGQPADSLGSDHDDFKR